MSLYKPWILLCLLITLSTLRGQDGISTDKGANEIKNIKEYFTKGHFHGHIRNSSMATINSGELYDYWTNATGGAIKYETSQWKGLKMGVSGIFTFQTFSSDLNNEDPKVNKGAKWEKELYDINRPFETKDLDRLEELFLQYNWTKSFVTIGKIDINKGPLLLRRDGRMKPFVYRGIWSEINEWDNHKIYASWINGVSPRGMTEWFSINEAIGMLNNGFQYNGTKAKYHEASHTSGIGILGLKSNFNNFSVEFWNYYFDNIYNTAWLQSEYKKNQFFIGAQFVFQSPDAEQKSIALENRYVQPDEYAKVISSKVGYQFTKSLNVSYAFLHGFSTGRFLFPKELGRENFYVSQPRSWIDGFGQVNVHMLRFQFHPWKEKWDGFTADLRLSYTEAPDKWDYSNNKYGRSSFAQSTLLTQYKFQGKLEGLELGFLYILKYSPKMDLSPSETFYKTNLHHFNLVSNIYF